MKNRISNILIMVTGIIIGMMIMLVYLNLNVEVDPQINHVTTMVNGIITEEKDKTVGVNYDVFWDDDYIMTF